MPLMDPEPQKWQKVCFYELKDWKKNYLFKLHFFCIEEFLHSAQMMSQITPLEVDILFNLCDLLHQTG